MAKLGSIIRHVLTTGGGILVGANIIPPEQAQAVSTLPDLLTGNGGEIVGGISILLGFVASLMKSWKK